MRIEIENLVVHGVAAADGERLARGIERELEALLGAGRVAVASSVSLPGGVFDIARGLGVDETARRVAEAICASCASAAGPSPAVDPAARESHTRAHPPAAGGDGNGE